MTAMFRQIPHYSNIPFDVHLTWSAICLVREWVLAGTSVLIVLKA